MRCRACDRILEESELTRKDTHGNFLDLCGICLSATANAGVDTETSMRYLQRTKSMIPSTKVYLGIYTKEEAVVVTTGVN
jgi:hypothetical protein